MCPKPKVPQQTGARWYKLSNLKLETEKNDLYGALRCVAQREFPCGVTKLPDDEHDGAATLR